MIIHNTDMMIGSMKKIDNKFSNVLRLSKEKTKKNVSEEKK